MIPVGTPCYIVGSLEANSRAIGDIVTVLANLVVRPDGVLRHRISRPRHTDYPKDEVFYWRPEWLRPIVPPDQTDDVPHNEEVTA